MYANDYGWRLLLFIKKKGVGMPELAEYVGMTAFGFKKSVTNQTLKLGTWAKLCEYFGLSMDEFNDQLAQMDDDEYHLLVLKEDPVEYVRRIRAELAKK
jgi:hypothetical protein